MERSSRQNGHGKKRESVGQTVGERISNDRRQNLDNPRIQNV